ncbi:MAG: 3-oxoacyl-ACP synthase [Nitrospirales bacterium]|nr:MAG: 3-oxoacyl-ACP synthase [Nitrospirales bacterium]
MYVTATGLVCSVGWNAASACAAMRAGIANFVQLPYHDNEGEPIMGGLVPELASGLTQKGRLIDLLAMAISDCLEANIPEPLDKVPLLVGMAEPDRPGGGAGLAPNIIEQAQERLGIRFHPKLSRVFPNGHTSGFEALAYTKELFISGGHSFCLICGVDSYMNAASLLWLNQHLRLKTTENSDGIIPGEAGAAVLVQREVGNNSSTILKVSGLGFAHEHAYVLSEEPLLGLGLAEAVGIALSQAGVQMHEVDFRVSDVTGEGYGFKEQALSLGRLMRLRREDLPIWHYADSIGDIGAAAGISELVVSMHSFAKNYAPGNRALCYTGSVLGSRAVAVVERE